MNKGKTINEYIVEHYGRVSNSHIAKIFNISEQAVYCRVSRLKAKRLISDKKPLLVLSKINKVKKEKKKKNNRLSKNNYSNSDGVFKQQARNIMKSAIKVEGTILSLPFETCELEKQILDEKPSGFNFIGCEMDLGTFSNMVNTILKNKSLEKSIKPYYGLVGDLIFKAKEDDYSNLILDYCGILDTFAKEIQYTIENNIVKVGGAICVTLSKMGISNDKTIIGEIIRKFPKAMFQTSMGETELATKIFFTNILGDNYTIETFFNYQDENKDENGNTIIGSNGRKSLKMPMMLVVIRRHK